MLDFLDEDDKRTVRNVILAGIGVAAGGFGLFCLGSFWRYSRGIQMGIINTVNREGLFFKTPEIEILRTARVAADAEGGLMSMSLKFDQSHILYEEALILATNRTPVKIHFNQYVGLLIWKSATNKIVYNFETL